MPEERPAGVQYHYIKSSQFRVLHADGIVGGPTPNGLIFLGLYSERSAIPQIMVHDITEAGQIGPERIDDRIGKKGIVREVEVGAVMSIETASVVISWLQERIDVIKKFKETAAAAAEKANAKNESTTH